MSDFKYIVPPSEPKIIRSPAEVGISPTVTEPINNSCLFNGTNASLNRTLASSGNLNTWTISWWCKRSSLANNTTMFGTSYTSLSEILIRFDSGGNLRFEQYSGGGTTIIGQLVTTQLFRDVSAWYHFVVIYDSGNLTSTDRVRLYVNGSRITAFNTGNYPSQNANSIWNANTHTHYIGQYSTAQYFDGYLTEINFIDGQALTPSSFGQYSNRTNTWVPKRYLGSYGTNGFYLKFNNSAALGTDSSGNNNTWTLNNITSSNQTSDSPTNNFCTLNPLSLQGATIGNGNLSVTSTGGVAPSGGAFGNFAIPTYGKWYWEFMPNDGNGFDSYSGISDAPALSSPSVRVVYYGFSGDKEVDGTTTSYGAAYTQNDIIGVAVNVDGGSVTFYKNNVSQGSISYSFAGKTHFPWFADGSSARNTSFIVNFGQKAFTYSPPAGFKSLCTANLNIPRIRKPNQFFDAKTYTGTGSTQSITGFNFVPDLVWLKSRSTANWHFLFDAIRGAGKWLASNQTGAEATNASSLVSFDSNGFSVSTDPAPDTSTGWNIASANQIAWSWCAGSSTVTNTAGSITSTVRANPTAGFSIVSYTGNGTAGATVGHGLGVAPKFIIVKNRQTNGYDSVVYHQNMNASPATGYLSLNATIAFTTLSTIWNNTAPSSSVITFGTNAALNETAKSHIAYCFAEVEGYSRFGSYAGNASADGPFIYCGFRPRWILIKRIDTGSKPWCIHDTARDTYNVSSNEIEANASTAENGGSYPGDLDILSNGFKPREGSTAWINENGTFIFAAFAETPFKYANAR